MSGAVEKVLEDWARRYAVTDAECEILGLASVGFDNGAISSQRGTAPSTTKKQVSAICRKLRAGSLAACAVQLLSSALVIVELR